MLPIFHLTIAPQQNNGASFEHTGKTPVSLTNKRHVVVVNGLKLKREKVVVNRHDSWQTGGCEHSVA